MLKRSKRFALLGLIVVIAATALAVGSLYRHLALRSLVEMGGQNNKVFARSMANALGPTLASYLTSTDSLSVDTVNRDTWKARLRSTISVYVQAVPVPLVQFTMYDSSGRIVYSTGPNQFGGDRQSRAAYQSLQTRHPASQLIHRNRINLFDQVLRERDLLLTYVPLRLSAAVPIDAVIEIGSDVTSRVQQIAHAQWLISAVVMTVLFLLYAGVCGASSHAEFALKRRYAEREAAQEVEIHECRLAEARASYFAHHDVLTGLPNRALFVDRLKQAIARAERNGHLVAVLYLDLDRFKTINDTLGHATGDEVLKFVGALCTKDLREMDTVARLGGDEFVMLLDDVGSIDEVGSVAKRLLTDFAKGFEIGGRKQEANASIGISLFPADGRDADTLIHNADAAMYHAKKNGCGAFHFFQSRMTERVTRRISLESDLRNALDRQELSLHYQPIFDLRSGRLVGAEALIQWNHPARGWVPPMQFIPAAEDIGLIVPFGEWVLHEACAQATRWASIADSAPFISVNISSRQLQDGKLITAVEHALACSDLSPTKLELEFPDTAVLLQNETSARSLHALGSIGVKLAIDDFGSGPSAISFINRFRITKLKIEKSFLHDVTRDHDHQAIVTAIMAIARTFGLSVTAKGIERMDQVGFLIDAGCDQVQGYLYGRPSPAVDFERLIRTRPTAGLPVTYESTLSG